MPKCVGVGIAKNIKENMPRRYIATVTNLVTNHRRHLRLFFFVTVSVMTGIYDIWYILNASVGVE